MPAYAVRLNEHAEYPKDLVGVFVADNAEALGWLVDECCDAGACEYTSLPSGGIYMPKKAAPVPYGQIGESEDVDFFPEASFCEDWVPIFITGDEGRWKPLIRP
jgi:hypothetical protein